MDNFERLLALAEFGAKRHEDRRQVEFRVSISYITLLALAFYHFNKGVQLFGLFSNNWGIKHWWLILAFIFVHWFYCFWQKGLCIAMENDANRRNFFLAKAECLADYFIHHPNATKFNPDIDKKVKVYFCKDKVSEVTLFEKTCPPDITILHSPWKNFFKCWDIIWRDWSRLFHFAIPTIMIFTLFCLKLTFWWAGFVFSLPFLLLPFIGLCQFIFKKK